MRFPKILQKEEPNYKIMEVEAERDKNNYDYIESLKSHLASLEVENEFLRSLLTQDKNIPAAPNMVDVKKIPLRPRLRTMSDVGGLLEERSLRQHQEFKEAKVEVTKNEV